MHFLPPTTTFHLQAQGAAFKSNRSRARSVKLDYYMVGKLDAMPQQVDGVGVEDIDKEPTE